MRERDFLDLEYDKFLSLLSDFTPNSQTQSRILKLKPYRDLKIFNIEKSKTEEFITVLKEEGYIPLSQFPDISKSLELLKIQDSILLAKDIYEIGKFLQVVKELKSFFGERKFNHLKVVIKDLYPLREIEKIIFDSIDNTLTVKDGASFDLRKIRRHMKEVEDRIISALEKFINTRDIEEVLQDRFITIKRDRYVIPVKHSFASRVKGIIQDRSSSGQTVFIEPMEVVNLNNQLLDLKLQEAIEIRKILKFITELLRSKLDFIKRSFEALLEIDLLYSKGKYAIKFGCTFPEISSKINLRRAYHPIFLLKEKDFNPFDIDFLDKRGLLITGSNTGGKTVALKTVGLLSLISQSAIPIPVDEGSTIPFFDGIFIDIGDSQSIEENLSTYSAHISNINHILQNITKDSLVLLDELIPGTDPDFASSLGIAILDKIIDVGSFIIATTHLKRIKLYGLDNPYFRLSAVGFDKETLTPTYQIIYDTVGESMAFYIAGKLGLDGQVLQKAKSITDNHLLNFEDIVSNLNRMITEYSQKLMDIEKSKENLEKELGRYKDLVDKLEKDRRERWKEGFKEIEYFIENIRKEGYEILDKVKEEKTGKRLEAFIKTKRQQISTVKEEKINHEEFKEGDTVKIKGKSQKGTVLSVREGKVKVDFNGFKIWIDPSELQKTDKEEKIVNVNVYAYKPKIKQEINLIGKTKEEAFKELQDYIDKAILLGITTFKVIHGFGSGILRKAVREFLDRQPFKIKYEDAPYNEGGLGATIVYLE